MDLVHWPECRGGDECRCVESGSYIMQGTMRRIAEKIALEEITSSNLAAIGYNEHKRIAALRFKSGDVFHYADVPREVFEAWYLAESRGKFYAANVRGKYRGEKMTGTCPKCGDRPGWIGETCADCGCATYAADERPERVGDGASSGI